MKCPNCTVELLIDHTEIVVEGDSAPDTPTKVYNVPYYSCPKADCPGHGKLTPGEPILIYG